MNPFDRLAPFIQEYIYKHQWNELRSVQVEACRVIFDSDTHLILSAGTASGKTEAAFLPILTLLHNDPAESIGALYIGPTKALINDQFYRLQGLLEESAIPVWAWHGDISSHKKKNLLKHPSGILQITPESLESLLMRHTAKLPALFGDLRFVVIDELHVLMNSDRGRQLLCQLERLERVIAPPRRIGLSATLGNTEEAEKWLQAKTTRRTVTIKGETKGKIRLSIESFELEPTENTENAEMEENRYWRYLFESAHQRSKVLIFANRRSGTEEVIASFREMAKRRDLPDIYHVHHGSISAELRESAESALKTPDQPAIAAATVTLELGIDIGHLERVIQLNAPFSVASFLQRLGRSGRRGDPSEMWIVLSQEQVLPQEQLLKKIPWSLLQTIAIIQLYVEDRWVEPVRPIHYPFSLLYHQTMAILASSAELSPAELARRVLTLAPFKEITQEEYRIFLRHLIQTEQIQRLEQGTLIIGLAGEKIVNNFRFYAVFAQPEEYSVVSEKGEIGRIVDLPAVGNCFALAGRTWQVLDVQERQRTIFVKQIQGRAKTTWVGYSGEVHDRIVQKMKTVLIEDHSYPYLQPSSREQLIACRTLAKQGKIGTNHLIPMGGDKFALLPWRGTIAFETIEFALGTISEVTVVDVNRPYYILFKCSLEEFSLRQILTQLPQRIPAMLDQIEKSDPPLRHKYDQFVPIELLRKGFSADSLDLAALSIFQ